MSFYQGGGCWELWRMAEAILLCSSLMMQCRKGSAESELRHNHSSGSGGGYSLQWEHAVPKLQGRCYGPTCECFSRTMLHKKWQGRINNLLPLVLGFLLKGIWKRQFHCTKVCRLAATCLHQHTDKSMCRLFLHIAEAMCRLFPVSRNPRRCIVQSKHWSYWYISWTGDLDCEHVSCGITPGWLQDLDGVCHP